MRGRLGLMRGGILSSDESRPNSGLRRERALNTVPSEMHLKTVDQWLLAWVVVTSAGAFLLFGFDKWRAGRTGSRRIAESSLWLVSALGGWPGGLLGIVVFRHKSSKPTFLFKFILALLVWAALVAGAWKLTQG